MNQAVQEYVALNAWQVEQIEAGIAAADRGDLATPEVVEAVRRRPATRGWAGVVRIVWTRPALRALADVEGYVSQGNPVAASRLITQIFDHVATLADHPHLGRAGRRHSRAGRHGHALSRAVSRARE